MFRMRSGTRALKCARHLGMGNHWLCIHSVRTSLDRNVSQPVKALSRPHIVTPATCTVGAQTTIGCSSQPSAAVSMRGTLSADHWWRPIFVGMLSVSTGHTRTANNLIDSAAARTPFLASHRNTRCRCPALLMKRRPRSLTALDPASHPVKSNSKASTMLCGHQERRD